MNIWDWKFRVFFDESIKEQLETWQKTLTFNEVEIYNEICTFYCSFFSFGMLWDLIVEDNSKTDEYLEKALLNKTLIIKTPYSLMRYYKKQIRESRLTVETKNNLMELLDFSKQGREIRGDYWDFVAKLFGNSFENMIKNFSSQSFDHSFVSLPRQRIIEGNCKEIFENIYSEITFDAVMQEKFGVSAIRKFDTQIIDGNGYGEWWDREISDSGEDELVLYTNDNKVKSEDYRYTIIHETYPGHGHFYNSVRAENDSMDHGAMSLIEGWATYCEWNTYPSSYVKAIKHNALAFLWESMNLPCDDFAASIVNRNKKKNKPFKKYVTNLIYSTQYVGYIESYYLGALWMELALNNGQLTPKSFLDMLSKNSKGEFFRLWL